MRKPPKVWLGLSAVTAGERETCEQCPERVEREERNGTEPWQLESLTYRGPTDIKENNSGPTLIPLFYYGHSDLSLLQPQCVSPISLAVWMQLICCQSMKGGTAYLMLCLNLQIIHSST